MSEVLVVIDHADGEVKKPTYELLALAARLGEPSAVFIGPAAQADAAAEAVKGYGAEKVYVVDDAQIKGYLVAPKAEALQQLAENSGRFNIVFSDVVMPGMSGLELLGRLLDLADLAPSGGADALFDDVAGALGTPTLIA